MSLARAFTTRRANRNTADMGIPQRSNSTRPGLGYSASVRHKISAPMELTHTTNMLAYNAPDLYPQSASSSTDSSKSEDDSDGALTHSSSPPTSPEVGSVEDLTAMPAPPHLQQHQNHLSCDFTVPGQKHTPFGPAPSIPKRAPSHTKKASYEAALSQQHSRYSNHSQRSASTKASFTLSRTSSTSTTATTATSVSSDSVSRKPSVPALPQTSPMPPHRKTAEAQHPFGQELARVTELAEDYGVKEKLTVAEQEEREMIAKGLCVFQPQDYLDDIQSLFADFFLPQPAVEEPIWI